jgi:hypothetical protein
MFSEIDKTIFPENCEVLEIVPSQFYVYPIFKNASSSLRLEQPQQGWKSIYNNDIKYINCPITIFVRDPKERFISGVNTFVQHCIEQEHLDIDTVLYFVKNFLFLNRHYVPQFHWLINLSRYIDKKSTLLIQSVDEVKNLTKFKSRAGIKPASSEFLDKIQDFPWNRLELYFMLDQLLIDCIGKEITIDNLIDDIRKNHLELYNLIFQQNYNILNVLPKA